MKSNLSKIFNETECQYSTVEDNKHENSRTDKAVGIKEIFENYIFHLSLESIQNRPKTIHNQVGKKLLTQQNIFKID